MVRQVRIALGADHAGYELKGIIAKHLIERGFSIHDMGTHSTDAVDYPEYGFAVGKAVRDGEADVGILVCGTGQGMAITVNKLAGIRAAACGDTFSAKAVREHNNANILALGARVTGQGLALDIVDVFLQAEFLGGKHARRLALIADMEQK